VPVFSGASSSLVAGAGNLPPVVVKPTVKKKVKRKKVVRRRSKRRHKKKRGVVRGGVGFVKGAAGAGR
jgi:hypothetical protein